jgi:glutathione S-transferase
MLKLYYAPNACSLASHIALEDCGAAYETVRLNLKAGDQDAPAYRALNPKGRVPTLVTDNGVLTESAVILGFIAHDFPNLAKPGGFFAFSQMQDFNIFLASSVHIAFAHLFRPGRFGDGEVAAAAMRTKLPEALGELFGLVEAQLADGRPWVHGEHYTVSDPYLFVFARWLERDGAGGSARFPLTRAHRSRMNERPAVQKVLAAEGIAPL